MKKIRLFLLALFLVLTFSLVSVSRVNGALAASTSYSTNATDEEKVAYDKERIQLPTSMITSFPVTVESIYGSTLTWTSSDETVLNTSYVSESGWVELIRNETEDKTATLTVTIVNGTATATKSFDITVPGGVTIVKNILVSISVDEGLDVPIEFNVKAGQAYRLPDAQDKAGYEFIGWFGNKEGTGRKYTTTLGLINDTTLYAVYEKISVKSISVSQNPTKTVYTALEKFDSTGLELLVKYNYGNDKTITEGFTVEPATLHGDTTEVVVSYGGQTTTVAVTVNPITMSGVTLGDSEVVYDGSEHNLVINGELPEWLDVTYSAPVIAANEGGYQVTATFSLKEGIDNSHNDYVVPDALTATLVIKKATYDMSQVKYEDLEAVYDGNAHEITVTGLPTGVTADCSYTDNVNAGDCIVTISFTGDENYNAISVQTTTLIIAKADPIVNPVIAKGPYFVGSGAPTISLDEASTAGEINWDETYTFVEGENTFNWTFTPNSNNYNAKTGSATLDASSAQVSSIEVTAKPNNKTRYVAFEKFETDGIVVTAIKEDGTSFEVSADNYIILYTNGDSFRAGDTSVTIEYLSKTFVINGLTVDKATYDMSNISFEGLEQEYDGNEHTITVNGLPKGVTASFKYPESIIEVGDYSVEIEFAIEDNDNYNDIDSIYQNLIIKKATISIEDVVFESKEFTYDGTSKSIEVTNVPEGVTVSYENNGKIGVGEYTVTANFEVLDGKNYNEITDTLTATLTINAKSIAVVTVSDIATIIVDSRSFDAKTPDFTVKDGEIALVLSEDYKVVYSNNTEIKTGVSVIAIATISGTGNYTGEKQVEFVIELSKEFKLREDVIELGGMTTVDTDTVSKLPLTLSNGSTVVYSQLPTAITMDAEGNISVAKTTEQQSYTVIVIVVNGNFVEYVEMTFTISQAETTKSFTENDVTLENVPAEITSVVVSTKDATSSNYQVFTTVTKAAYDITLLNGEDEVNSFTNAIKVTLPCPAGIDFESIVVYHILDDGTKEVVNGVSLSEDGQYLVFETTSFSVYTIVEKLAKNDGTAEHPFTVEEAVNICNTLDKNEEHSDKEFYVKGIVKSVKDIGSMYTVYLEQNGFNGDFQLYQATLSDGVFVPEIGDTVVAKGKLLNYNGTTPEFKKGSIIFVEVLTYTVSVSSTDTTKGNPYIENEGTIEKVISRGSSVVITLNPASGYSVKTILVNGSSVDFSGDTYTLDNINENKTVSIEYFEPTVYTITFEANNSTPTSTQDVVENQKLQKPEDPTLEGKVFGGWYKDSAFTVLYDFNTLVTESFTLYAKWDDKSQSGTNNKKWVKVTENLTDWSGNYLIVYEAGKVAFNGALTTLDESGNYISITIVSEGSYIAYTDDLAKSTFTIAKVGENSSYYSIKSSSGKFIGNTSNSNALSGSDKSLNNTIEYDEDGALKIISSGGAVLRYNATSNQERFRYYKASTYNNQKEVALYKLVEITE